MESAEDFSGSAREQQLNELLALYLASAEAGTAPHEADFLAAHPEFAGELQEFFSDRRRFTNAADAAVEPLSSADEPTLAAPQSAAAPSKTVRYFGDYELLEEISRGGMGVVYRSRQVNLKRIVALKMILVGQLANEDEVRRFYAEAEAAAKLEHPNIVPIFEIGQHDGQHYFSMAYIEGESLASRVARGVLQPREAAEILLKVARAIAYAHLEGVVHRDLKPANILLDRSGEPHVTDFGLAKRMEADPEATSAAQLTQTGQVLGTPGYMPPEQAAGKTADVGRLSDVYSLGAVLYCLLIGRPPFQAASPLDTLLQVIHQEPVPPRALNAAVPRDLETICLRCMEKEPRRRYASAAELADDVQRYLNDEPIHARPTGAVEQVFRLAKKHRRTLIGTAVTLAASIVLVAGSWSGWQAWQEAQKGKLGLRTRGPHLIAEIVDEHDKPVVPSVPVPTSEPVKLPEGSYRLKLSSSGVISDSWPMDIGPGESKTFNVQFRSRLLWPPREMSGEGGVGTKVVELTDHASILELRQNVSGGATLRLIDGATGKPAWPEDLVFSDKTVPAGRNAADWTTLPQGSTMLANTQIVHRPQVDFNGDGTRDLLFAARRSSSLAAFSGSDGKLLWWRRSLPRNPGGPDPETMTITSSGTSTIVGQPSLADVNGDGTTDVIACVMSAGEYFQAPTGGVRTQPQGWIEAVSGRDGTPLWRQPLKSTFASINNNSDVARRYHRGALPVVLRGKVPSVILALDGLLLRFDLATGRPIPANPIRTAMPIRPPLSADLDGNGEDDLLLLSAVDSSGNTDDAPLTLTAIAPAKGVLWTKTFQVYRSDAGSPLDAQSGETSHSFFQAIDLQDDGRSEVVLATGHFRYGNEPRWSGLEALDGRTGKTLWLKVAARTNRAEPPDLDRFLSGPDLDGDGHRELFLAWNLWEWAPGRRVGSVAALSGRTGERLWQTQNDFSSTYSTPDPSGPLDWWQPGPDGWPLLTVPVAHGPGGQAMTYFLEAATGRLAHTLAEVYDPHIADFNGDGLRDVSYTVSPQGAARLLVAGGMQPEPWARLGAWQAVQDMNGDRVGDLLQWEGTTVRSGRTGERLVSLATSQSHSQSLPILAPPLPYGDLNRDGVPDLVGVRERNTGAMTLAAFSGKDGQSLWAAEKPELGSGRSSGSGGAWSYEYPMSDWCELDGDGTAEFLVVSHGNRGSTLLSVNSGADGKLRWQTPIANGAYGIWPDPYGREFHDLDGDGVRDLVLWTPLAGKENSACELQAYSGRDGHRLWITAPARAESSGELIWPRPAVGDLDGDSRPDAVSVIIKGRDSQGRSACEVVAIDGKSGRVRWTFPLPVSFTEFQPPLLIDFDGNKKRSVCLSLWGEKGRELLILDADGRPRPSATVTPGTEWRNWSRTLWTKVDPRGDGRELLVYQRNEFLCAQRHTGDSVWQWKLPQNPGPVPITGSLLPALPATKGRPAVLPVWVEGRVVGLTADTGIPAWRCDVPFGPGDSLPRGPFLELMSSDDPSGLPRVLCGSRGGDDWRTIVKQAWPTTPDGRFLVPAARTRQYVPLPDETPAGRRLPWLFPEELPFSWLLSIGTPSGLFTFALVLVPFWLARSSLRGPSLTAALLLAGWSGACVIAPGRVAGAIPACIALVTAVGLGRLAIRQRSPRAMGTVLGMLVLLLAPLVLRWSWRTAHDVPGLFVDEMFDLVLVGIPGAVFWIQLVSALRRGEGRHVALLLVSASVLSGAVVAFLLTLAAGGSPQPYSFAGAWVVWLWGAHLTGVVMIAAWARRGVWSLLPRRLRPAMQAGSSEARTVRGEGG